MHSETPEMHPEPAELHFEPLRESILFTKMRGNEGQINTNLHVFLTHLWYWILNNPGQQMHAYQRIKKFFVFSKE